MPTLRSLRSMEEEDEKKKREREARITREREQRTEFDKMGEDTGALTWDEMGDLPPERPSEESLGAFTNIPRRVGEETEPGSGERWQDVTEKPYWRKPPPSEVSPGEGKMSMRDAFRENVISNVFSGNDPYLLNPDDALEELTLQYPEIYNDLTGMLWADRNDAPLEVKKFWHTSVLRMRSDAFKNTKQGIDMRKKALDDMLKQFDETQGEKAKQERVREKEARSLQEWRTKEKEEEETQKRKEGRALETQIAKEGRVAKKEKEKPPKEPTSTQWNMLNKFEKENTDPITALEEKMPEPLLRRWNRMRVSMGLPEMEGVIEQEAKEGTGIAGLVGIGDVKELWSYAEKEEKVEPEKAVVPPTASTPTAADGGDNIKAELGYWKFLNESQSPDKIQRVKSAFRDQYGYVPTRIPMQYRQMFQ